MTIHETREEWACIEEWLQSDYPIAFGTQKFAIALMGEFLSGFYYWHLPDGSKELPEYNEWDEEATKDQRCVSMLMGPHNQGHWMDDTCDSTDLWAICEKI